MSYNFINEASSIKASTLCAYDTARGYETDFNENGNVDGWDYFDGIHTYGAWGGFLFGTLYGSYALIGRTSVFPIVPAKTHYTIKISMKISLSERVGSQALPTTGRVMWVTTSNPVWGSDKQMDFTIYADNLWHIYSLNMGVEQWWQGNIRNLRIYPVYEDGRDGDEFFIKTIKIISLDTYNCLKPTCSYYPYYSHPCGGIGSRGYCQSSSTGAEEYTIEAGVNDELIVDINDYGNEIIKLDEISGATGEELSKIIAKSISKVGVGGYAETEVSYTEAGEFKIYSGTYVSDSTAVIKYSNAAVTLGFFDSDGNDLSSKVTGSTPASKFKPASSFKIKTFQLLNLFTDNNVSFKFDPTSYNVEGGRRDWLESGLGASSFSIGDSTTSTKGKTTREVNTINNDDKTVIDFNHPFNASGRIKKISLMCTLDQGYEAPPGSEIAPGENFSGRLEATGCKIKILRPKRDGTLKTITSIDIPDRDYSAGQLISVTQEVTEIDCDVWVNKGDLIGVYNANLYIGKSITGTEVDALYYHVNGEAAGEFDPGQLKGDGIGGLLVYARSDEYQNRLSIDVDFGNRINIEEVNVIGTTEARKLEFNVARCLDINWSVDLFGGTHYTGHYYTIIGEWYGLTPRFLHTNEAYGIDCLSDGILAPSDGLAADSYSISPTGIGNSTYLTNDSSPGITVTNPRYFFCNGDGEWLGVYNNIGNSAANAFIEDFDEDPIAFTLLFPYGTTKKIYKSVVYFKEKYNFRNFALSVTYNLNDVHGDADDPRFHLIEEYPAVSIDYRRIEKDGPGYDQTDLYLFANPCNGQPVVALTGERTSTGGKLGFIDNYESYLQSVSIDWNVISHEFDNIECKGFRFYCDYHESTKINEMELYCMVEDVGSSMISSVDILHSHYNDLWWVSALTENADNSVTAFIGDTSRYFSIEIEPISIMNLNNIRFDVKEDSVFVGKKGCEFQLLPIHSKLDATNQGQNIDIKNIYGDGFDLYVDIAKDPGYDEGLVFYSRLNNTTSIINPEVGPDARYHKEDDYRLLNYNKNCAINNECYGLRNLIDGKSAYYSYLGAEHGWQAFGTLAAGASIDFSNIEESNMTIINLSVVSRNRYWKFGWLCGGHPKTNVREIKLFYEDVELEAVFYHDKNLEYEVGPISDTAPHLNNNSATGSYYELKGDHYIGFDLGSQKIIDKIILYHDSFNDYDETYCGIDKYTELCLTVKNGDIVDYSYDERSFTIVGAGIEPAAGYWDVGGSKTAIGFSGHEDSYISVPGSSDFTFTGTSTAYIGAPWYAGPPYNEASTVDFFVEFDSLPTTSGHCTLIRNWADVVETSYFGDIQFPPPQWLLGTVSSREAPQPNANWAIFVRNETNRAAAVRLGLGGSYESSAIQYGPVSRPWNGTFVSYLSLKNSASPMYVRINLPTAKKINRYGIYAPDYTNQCLRDWQLQAYVTSSGTWLDLHSVTGHTGTYTLFPREMPYWNFTNPYEACTSYRILITANNGHASYTLLTEVELYDGEENDLCQLEVWAQSRTLGIYSGYTWARNVWTDAIVVGQSYNISMFRNSYEWSQTHATSPYNWLMFYVNGVASSNYVGVGHYGMSSYAGDLIIGKGVDGVMTDVRITNDLVRRDYTPTLWHPKERYYVMSAYISDDNYIYGKYLDVDLIYDQQYHYYDSDNTFSLIYDSYFAIDLGRRYDLDIIRSYGLADAYTISGSVEYSNNDVSNINSVSFDSDYNDARWLRIGLPNDGTTKIIRKLGVYPNISTRISPEGSAYNHEWDSLGKSITTYGSEENIAFNTTVSGSYFGMQYKEKVVNGIIPVNTEFGQATLNDVWGSETENNPWITVDLGEVYEIYRIKIYHGYDGEDTDYLITDYTVRTSTDNQSFTTRFTITSNSAFERTHDLSSAVSARYVKIDITGYDSENVYLRTDYEGGTAIFNGAVLREIEVYEDYSAESISSEEYPIICINLQDQFFLESHSIVGFDAEDSSSDWSNDDSNFCYSDYVLDNPSKIDFREWGEPPVYDQWMVVKMDTATNYNSGPHYLKHVRAESETGQNPCEYPWWWSSNVSTLSRDYDYHVTNSVSAIRIDYPATDVSETISFYEGDNFGIDEYAAFRDGFNFRIRIDNIDNLDMSYGYFYFGGYDSTDGYNSIIHKWYFSTLSGTLDTGWTDVFLRFKNADEIDYTTPADESVPDVRIPNTITFGTIGMVFRGVGTPLTMHLDGFYIRRNLFNDYVAHGNGLYLTGRDYLTCPIGQFDLSLGTIELWLRPDFDNFNYDFYETLKNRAIFQFSNNANDVFGLMYTFSGFEVYSGNINRGLDVFTLANLGIYILDVTFHLGIVFSNDGTQIDNDGSTVRIYLNNMLVAKSNITWDIYDNKHFQFMLGGQGPLALKEGGWTYTSSMDAVVCNLRIYNYCKTDFEKSMLNRYDRADDLIKPSSLIQISRDNLTFYNVGDAELPLKFEAVPMDTVTPVYVRTDVPSSLIGKEKRTGGLLVYWDMAI